MNKLKGLFKKKDHASELAAQQVAAEEAAVLAAEREFTTLSDDTAHTLAAEPVFADEEASDDEPDTEFPEQLQLANYRLLSKIGEGAFSKVYRAKPLPPSNCELPYVAVKIINKAELAENDRKKHRGENNPKNSRAQVLNEIMIHKTVSRHENIVTFVDFIESDDYYFIIQELVSGGEIFGEIVRLTYFSEDLCRHVVRQLALAVQHMHSVGIVHRDIKPENLLFEPIEFIPSAHRTFRASDNKEAKEDEGVFRPGVGAGGIGVVKLADFGLSKQILSSKTKTPCGTVGYTAPEVVKDERYSMKVDSWGVGCVLYTMLCGFPPFYDERIDVLTEKIARGQYTFLKPWWDEISDGAKQTVCKLLEVDPHKRYSMQELLEDPWLNTYDCVSPGKHKMDEANERSKRKHRRYKIDTSLLYSPAANAMREAFDVSNALHREEEEKKKKTVLMDLMESDELEIEKNFFNLSLDGSTILNRRKKQPATAH